MSVLTHPAPAFSLDEAAALAKRLYGRTGTLEPLASERDQNFKLTAPDGSAFVLKIANAREPGDVLAFQSAMLAHVHAQEPGLPIPDLVPALDGSLTGEVERQGSTERHGIRLVTYLPGSPFAKAEKTEALLRDLGRVLGRLDRALQSFGHPGAHRDLDWDIRRAGAARERLVAVSDQDRRALLARHLDRFERETAPRLKRLRAQVIHGDANDWNVFVDAASGARIAALIDFGDSMHTALVGELAIAAAYAILDAPAPLSVAAALASGYHAEMPLTEEEADCLYDLIVMRLVTSVTMSAARQEKVGDNPYLAISEKPAWATLERLAGIEPIIARGVLRRACRWEAAEGARRAVAWIRDNRPALAPVLDRPMAQLRKAVVPFADATHPMTLASMKGEAVTATDLWREWSKANRLETSLGPWGEVRTVYATDAFKSRLLPDKRRQMHLGIDIFEEAGTPVRTPLGGIVADVDFRPAHQDYGGMVLLRHEPEPGVRFWSLWGHLSEASVKELKVGQTLDAGSIVARMGEPTENGNWIPHLHLQLITADPGRAWDVPGVGEAELEGLWRELYPDATGFAGIPPEAFESRGRSLSNILEARRQLLGANLSIAYAEPLKMVRGEGVWLIDHTGRAYLDCFNNVAHLGHSHPRVIAALECQAERLNTNTRYLHDAIIDYAERLTATLPDPLKVCFFVCTGSEANDLAIRMARAHTSRRDLITVDWAYHGHNDVLIDISPYKYKRPGGTGKPDHVWEVPMPDVYRAPADWPRNRLGSRYAAAVAETVERMVRAGRPPSAFFLETVMSCGGQIFLPEGYMKEAFAHVRCAGGVCVADEVQIGFGRIGTHMWAFEAEGAVPDIVTLGKPIGNGHPMAALVTTPEIARSFANGMEYFNTFGGNPVSCEIGLRVLDVIAEEDLMANARDVGSYILQGLEALKARHEIIGDVRGRGLFIGVDLVTDRRSKGYATEAARRVVNRAKDLGVLLGTDGPYDNVIKIRPAMIFNKANADHLLGVLDEALTAAG